MWEIYELFSKPNIYYVCCHYMSMPTTIPHTTYIHIQRIYTYNVYTHTTYIHIQRIYTYNVYTHTQHIALYYIQVNAVSIL